MNLLTTGVKLRFYWLLHSFTSVLKWDDPSQYRLLKANNKKIELPSYVTTSLPRFFCLFVFLWTAVDLIGRHLWFLDQPNVNLISYRVSREHAPASIFFSIGTHLQSIRLSWCELFYLVCLVFTEFYRVWSGFTEFLLSFSEFYRVYDINLPSLMLIWPLFQDWFLPTFNEVLPCIVKFYRVFIVFLGFTDFYWILPSFTRFNWI